MKVKARKILKEIFTTLVMFVVFSTGYGLYVQRDMPKGIAPDLQSVQLDGTAVDLQELSKGQAVLVYFWGSWCSICTGISPWVSKLSDKYPVVTVAMASGDDERVSRYLEARALKFPVINDSRNIISREWQASAVPAFFIVKDGEIQSVTTGFTTTPGLLARLWWHS